MQRKKPPPPRFIPAPKPKTRRIEELTIRELEDTYHRNLTILSKPSGSRCSHIPRINAEQASIETRLIELGVRELGNALSATHLTPPEGVNEAHPVDSKRRAIEKSAPPATNLANSLLLPLNEAIAIEQEAHQEQLAKQHRQWERRHITGRIMPGEVLTMKEREQRISAFMNYKATNSDLEDENEEDNDDMDSVDSDDSVNWVDPYKDDSEKGHPLVYPDEMEYIIQVDRSHIGQYSVMKIED